MDEVGYLEKASDNNLYNKIANAGDKNYTKYGKELHEIYPTVMDYPAYWCDCFVDWCFYTAYGVCNAKKLLCGDFNDYTVLSAQMYKSKNSYYSSNPKIGDQIFFNNGKRICHTGIVYKVDSAKVYTIEGNTSSGSGVVSNGGCVACKSYSLTNTKIDGYGRPNYDCNTVNTLPRKVIDVSHHNVLDWNIVSDSVSDIIIRMGFIGSTTGILTTDRQFLTNIKQATKHNMNIGIYVYNQAVNESEAIALADYCLDAIRGYKITYPIYIDDEPYNTSTKKGAGRADSLSREQRTKNVIAFCNRIKSAGYKTGVYTSESFYKSRLIFSELNKDWINIWVAKYSKNKPSTERYEMWQYGSEQFDFAPNPIDVNYVYTDYTSNSNNIIAPTPISPSNNDYKEYYQVRIVTANALRIRDNPNGNKIGLYKKGDIVSIVGIKDGWYKTDKGYISGNGLYSKPSTGTIINCTKLNFRDKPKDGVILKSCNKGTKFSIVLIDKDTGWYYGLIPNTNNVYGYCSNKYVTIT